jgi:DNA mismatch repair protein MutS
LFLHRLQPGGADRSYGIEVGRLAGLPDDVIARARAVLRSLEGEQLAAALQLGGRQREIMKPTAPQLTLFAAEVHPVVLRLRDIDSNTMTPLEALRLVDELVRHARET